MLNKLSDLCDSFGTILKNSIVVLGILTVIEQAVIFAINALN